MNELNLLPGHLLVGELRFGRETLTIVRNSRCWRA